MKKYLTITFVASALTLSTFLFINATSTGAVKGKIEGISLENGAYSVYGWACEEKSNSSINVHMYLGGVVGTGKIVRNITTQYVAEPEIVSSCGSVREKKHRFKIQLSESMLNEYGGKPLYIYGIRSSGQEAALVEHSGTYRVPHSLSRAPLGCSPTSLFEKSSRNTYMTGYEQAQGDVWNYVAWVWRETPDAASSNSLSVARSKDLINWENTCGERLTLPINSDARAVVDLVLPYNGIINGVKLAFDSQQRPVISYHKHRYMFSTTEEPKVTTQVYNARLENGRDWKIYEMTNWNTKANQVGGGSLGSSNTTPYYTQVLVDRDGVTYQRFARPSADSTGIPANDTYYTIIDVKGRMTIGPRHISSKIPDPFNPSTPALPTEASQLETRDPNFKAKFVKKTIRASFDSRWINLRGDWDGDGINGAGLFDRRTSKFFIRDGVEDKFFQFGSNKIELFPIVGDWDGDRLSTVGIVNHLTGSYHVTNSLDKPEAAPKTTTLSRLPVTDGLFRAWYSVNPSLTHIITYETLPANRDRPYDCSGTPLTVADESIVNQCPEKFLSNLVSWTYQPATKNWSSEIIDRVWGIGGSFAYYVFKNHQIVAYYNSQRRVTVAIKKQGGKWIKQTLDRTFEGWDSHNNLTLAVDENHHVHLAGDQHVNPLNYWRGTLSLDFRRMAQTGVAESKVTYPSFFRSPKGDLLMQYRDGSSGDGDWIINQYNIRTGRWKRMLSTTLFDKR